VLDTTSTSPRAMLILALDIATRTGYAIGPAGEKPRTGAVRLRKPDEPLTVGSNNIGYFLKDLCVLDKPDLIAYEAPLDPVAKFEMGQNQGHHQNSASIVLPWRVVGVIDWFADLYGIRAVTSNRQAVLRHYTGRARWGSRKEVKKQVILRAQLLGHIPKDCRDDDIADACAIHDYASARYARVQPRELVMFGGA
jgi:hypothetical protein